MRVTRRTAVVATVCGAALAIATTGFVLARAAAPATGPAAAGPFVSAADATAAPTTGGPDTPGTDGAAGAARKAAAKVHALSAREAVTELTRQAASRPTLDIDRGGHVRLVAAPTGTTLRPAPGAPVTTDAVAAASAFVNRYGEGFGLRPGQRAVTTRVDALPGGVRTVRFSQRIGGVPVIGGDLTVAVTAHGGVVTATAETPYSTPSGLAATVTAGQAGATALAAAAAKTGIAASALAVAASSLWLYDPRVLGAPGRAELRPTWWVTVGFTHRAGEVATVLVDGTDGTAVLTVSERQTARNRLVCDLNNAQVDLDDPATYDCSDAAGGPAVVRREGGAASGSTDVNKAYDNLGATYDYYLANFGRDSIDGHGLPLRATVRVCGLSFQTGCPYANAFWDGAQMVFGAGFASGDDVVGHELTHGVTQYTSGLWYFSESGAINESMSDVFGEFIDQTRGTDDDSAWTIGEDLPIGAIRSLKNPTDFGQPDQTSGPLWDQAYNEAFDNAGVHDLDGVPNRTAYLIAAGGSMNGQTVTGLGIARAAQIYYRAQYLLPSGAQFDDLAAILPASCRSIVGFKGIVPANCDQVDAAVAATGLDWSAANPLAAPPCPSAGQPTRDLFADNLEHGTGWWQLDSLNWRSIPAASFPVSWADSGKHSLYSTLSGATSGTGHLARILRPFDIPATGSTYVWYATNNPGPGGGSLLYNTGSGWQGGLPVEAGSTSQQTTRGYDSVRINVSSLAGKRAQFALQPFTSTTGSGADWLVDDVKIYQCANSVGIPRHVAGLLSGDKTSADISWDEPVFAGPGVAGYEIGVSPTPAGLTLPVVMMGATTQLHLAGLDPTRRYTVSVQAIGTDGVRGPGVTVFLPTDPLVSCAGGVGSSGPPCVPLPG